MDFVAGALKALYHRRIVKFESEDTRWMMTRKQGRVRRLKANLPASASSLMPRSTRAELVKGKLKKAAKRKLPASRTRAKKSSKKAKKSSATRTNTAKKSKAK